MTCGWDWDWEGPVGCGRGQIGAWNGIAGGDMGGEPSDTEALATEVKSRPRAVGCARLGDLFHSNGGVMSPSTALWRTDTYTSSNRLSVTAVDHRTP